MTCTCGSILLPKGTKYAPYGLGLKVLHTDGELALNLVHDQNCTIDNGQKLITTTEKIKLDSSIQITNFELFWYKENPTNTILPPVNLQGKIQISIEDYGNKNLLGFSIIDNIF
jgi:hypothetical protein